MHASLTTKNNVRLSIAWIAALAVVAAISNPVTWGTLALGCALGLVGGTLQLNAMSVSADQLIATSTLVEVRHGLAASRSGKTYLVLFWVGQIALLIVSVLVYRAHALVAMAAGYFAFAACRDLISIPGTRRLERRAGATL